MEQFHGTVFFAFLRLVHFAINLKQAIIPEKPENVLVRKELSRLYSEEYVYLRLLINFIGFYLLSVLLYTKISNGLVKQSSNFPVTPIASSSRSNNTHLSANEQPPKRSHLNILIMVTLLIFCLIRYYTVIVLDRAEGALKARGLPRDSLQREVSHLLVKRCSLPLISFSTNCTRLL